MGEYFGPPKPAFSNPPIHEEFYKPQKFFISNITFGNTTTITTSENHDYVINQIIRLIIPSGNGASELNGQTGYVIAIPALNQVETTINSSQNVSSFFVGSDQFIPQIIAIGDNNNGIISSTGRIVPTTNIPGSFINIS